jgi:hypothetical protein
MRHFLGIIGLGLVLVSPLKADATDWEGLYVGLNLGQVSSNISVAYDHTRGGPCTNLNFGSEWPGDRCEGNQDYSTSASDELSGRTIGVSLERLWSTPQGIIGVQVNLSRGSGQTLEFSETISQTWGDTLDVGVSAGSSVDARLVYGVPMKEWMPFVAVGVGLLEVTTTYTQAHGGDVNYPSITETGADWTSRGIWGVGVKRDLGNDWVLSADLSHLRSKRSRFSRETTLVSGSLRYPDTVIDSVLNSTEIRFGLSRKF